MSLNLARHARNICSAFNYEAFLRSCSLIGSSSVTYPTVMGLRAAQARARMKHQIPSQQKTKQGGSEA